jgi:hypothetical protein
LFLALRKVIFKDQDHPSIANAFYAMAQQYSNLGQCEKALQAFQDVLGKRRKLK